MDPLCLAGVLYDWQVHPDQTKAVKGQNINTGHGRHYKEALAVPCRRDRKTGDLSQRKRENRVRGKKKRIRTKTERKEKKTKKEKRELV